MLTTGIVRPWNRCLGSLLWGALIAQLDQPSAACFSFSGRPGAEQGLDRRPWARSLLPKAPL